MITYVVNTGTDVHTVSSWDAENPLPLGETASINVTVRVFQTKAGPRFSLDHASENSQGESF